MNSNWGWIKQRPHFIAEGLSTFYNVRILAPKEYHKTVNNNIPNNLKFIFRLPFQSRSRVMEYLNRYVMGVQIWFLSRKFDTIWIASPLQYEFVKYSCKGKKVIYDCMDDQVELKTNERDRKRVAKYEQQLFDRADIIIASSNHLRSVLNVKYGPKRIAVVNNAIKDDFKSGCVELPSDINKKLTPDFINVTYIGTISKWMDFDLLRYLVQRNPNLRVNLFGPVDIKQKPTIDRVIYHGAVDHQYVAGVMAASDILIMPFIVNDLIKSVNPVKLYEYVYSGKPCMAPLYEESLPFRDFVMLYNSKEEACKFVEEYANNTIKLHEKEDCEEFALSNTWSHRIEEIKSIIGK